jgi:hypothetical protein
MAECFRGEDGVVRFSNSAVEQLYGALVALGDDLARTDEQRDVVRWLRDHIEAGAPGDRAFSLDPPPDEFSSPPRRVLLAKLIAGVAVDICATDIHQAQPKRVLDITWSDELRVSWLARLMDLHDLVINGLPTEMTPAPLDRQLPVLSSIRSECAVERLLRRLDELLPPYESDPAARLAAIDEAISVIASYGLATAKRAVLARLYSNQADALLEKKNIRSAIRSLRSSASFESDTVVRGATLEYAAALEHGLDGSA